MIGLLLAAIAYARAYVVSRHRLALEMATLRQQLVVFKRKRPRPLLGNIDRLFWVTLRQWWSGWAGALIIVKAETVVSWHRAGFRRFWRRRSRPLGRPKSMTRSGDSSAECRPTIQVGAHRRSMASCWHSASRSPSQPSRATWRD